MTTETIEKARALREKYPSSSARMRLQMARLPEERRIEMEEVRGDMVGKVEVDGFQVVVRWTVDEWHQGDYEFTNTPGLGTVENPKWREAEQHRSWGRNDHYHYIGLPGGDFNSHYKALQKMGYSKGVAAELAQSYVNQDVERALSDEPYYLCEVTAIKNGIELAQASIGGFDFGANPSYSDMIEWAETIPYSDGLIDEAITDAKAALEGLCCGKAD